MNRFVSKKRTSEIQKKATWRKKVVPYLVFISLNFVEEQTFFCNSDPHHLAISIIGALESLASQSKAQLKPIFLDIETTIKITLGSKLEKLTQRHNRREQARFYMSHDGCENRTGTTRQFLQVKKNQLIDLQEPLEQYVVCVCA